MFQWGPEAARLQQAESWACGVSLRAVDGAVSEVTRL